MAKRPLVSVGRPLPKLENLGLSLEHIENKRILVCFFDMQQRPSRNCILRLARQAQQLKQKEVTVVAVQASKIAEKTLNAWTNGHNIPFPVGIVHADETKTQFDWGVRSLPWPILTDKQHVVRDVGFTIDVLDEKLVDTSTSIIR